MPDKDGAEEKTTKSVVSKRQKQMMGEEGYDIARDMGRVKPSKDKKDATTMPPSKEMKKTQKVNKGPSALDIVKKKYKGQIMKMEELDLTQVAEAFGGYIIEQEEESRMLKNIRKAIKDLEQTQPGSGGGTLDQEINQRKLDQARQQERINRQYDIGGGEVTGTPQDFNKPKPETKPETKPFPSPEKIKTKTKSGKVTGDVESDFVGPKRARSKTATQNRTLQKIKVAARSTKRPVQRIAKPTGKLLTKTAKIAGKNPFATLVGASMAKDTFFPVALPKSPTVQGGKVGRRTAG